MELLIIAGIGFGLGWLFRAQKGESGQPVGGYELDTDCQSMMNKFIATLNKDSQDVVRAAIAKRDSAILEQIAASVEAVNPSLAFCFRSFK